MDVAMQISNVHTSRDNPVVPIQMKAIAITGLTEQGAQGAGSAALVPPSQ